MSWLDDAVEQYFSETTAAERGTGYQKNLLTGPAVEPVAIETIQSHAYLSRATAGQLVDLARFAKAARRLIEKQINKSLMQQTWQQTNDRVRPDRFQLNRGPYPILAVDSLEYIANDDSSTWLPWSSVNYYLTARELRIKGSWPSFRSYGGIRCTFKTGYALLADPNDEDEVAAAREAVPEDLRLAICDLAAFWFENREGQGNSPKYEVVAKSKTALPEKVEMVVDQYRDRRFLT